MRPNAANTTKASNTSRNPDCVPSPGEDAVVMEEITPPTTVSVVDLVETELEVVMRLDVVVVMVEVELYVELVLGIRVVVVDDMEVSLVTETDSEELDVVVRENSLDVVGAKLAR
jgi:hypothetical protein